MTNNLDANDLLDFGIKLYKQKRYGEALLVIHAMSFGVKIGKVLPLKWSDLIHKNKVKDKIIINGKTIPLNETCKEITTLVYFKIKRKIKLDDYVYVNKKQKLLETSNLSKNLKRLALDIYGKTYIHLTSSSMERAWALSVVEANHYSKEAFIMLTQYMGKRSVKDTIEFLGCEPKSQTEIRHDYIDNLTLSLSLT
jgi:hypothetical protein